MMIAWITIFLTCCHTSNSATLRGSSPDPPTPPPPPRILITQAYTLLNTTRPIQTKIHSTLRPTDIELRGIFTYNTRLHQECESDVAAVLRLGINATQSLPTLQKFQTLAINTQRDAITTLKTYNQLMITRQSSEDQITNICKDLHLTLNQWIQKTAIKSPSNTLLIETSTAMLPTGKAKAIPMPTIKTIDIEPTALDFIRKTRLLGRKKLHPVIIKSPPLPIPPMQSFPELEMKQMIRTLCESTESTLHSIVRLKKPILIQDTIHRINAFKIEIQELQIAATQLTSVRLDDKHVLEESETETNRKNILHVRDQQLKNYTNWLKQEKKKEKKRMNDFHPSSPSRCTIKCRKKLRNQIIVLAKHVGDMADRKEDAKNEKKEKELDEKKEKQNDMDLTDDKNDEDDDVVSNSMDGGVDDNGVHNRNHNNTDSKELKEDVKTPLNTENYLNSCSAHLECNTCLTDVACGWCGGIVSNNGIVNSKKTTSMCVEGVKEGPIFLPCLGTNTTWLHYDHGPSTIAASSQTCASVQSVESFTRNSNNEIKKSKLPYDRNPSNDELESVVEDPGKEMLSVDRPSRQYQMPSKVPNQDSDDKGEPPTYHGSDDLLIHGEGAIGMIAHRWNVLNAPCDGFGWTPRECDAGVRVSRKEEMAFGRLFTTKDGSTSKPITNEEKEVGSNGAASGNLKSNKSGNNDNNDNNGNSDNNDNNDNNDADADANNNNNIAKPQSGQNIPITSNTNNKDDIDNDIQHISNDISDQASESQSARSEIHETILSTGSATSGTRAANLKMPSVPLTINHVFPSEGDEGLPGMYDRNGEQAVDSTSESGIGGGGGGLEDQVLSVGSRVDGRWQGGCMYEPARIIAVNMDGTFDIEYDTKKTETRVLGTALKTPGVVGKTVCQVDGCIVVHGGGCGSGKWPLPIPDAAHKEVLQNTLSSEGGKCQNNRDCQTGFLCDPTKTCVNVGSMLKRYPALKKVVAPFGGEVEAPGTPQPTDQPTPNDLATEKEFATVALKGGAKPGGKGAPPCIPIPGLWPPKCTPTSNLPPKMFGLGVKKPAADPFPHGSYANAKEENAVNDVMKEVAGMGLGGAVGKAIKLAMKNSARKEVAGKLQTTNKGDKWRKDAFGGGCVMKPALAGGGPVDPDCVSEHIARAPGKVAVFPDPDKKQQTGLEPCKGLIHDLCSISSLVCCWFSMPNWVGTKDNQGECRATGSCDWSDPPPGAKEPAPKGGKPMPSLGGFPGPPPGSAAADKENADDFGGTEDPTAGPVEEKDDIFPAPVTKPGQGEDPVDMGKQLDKLGSILGSLGHLNDIGLSKKKRKEQEQEKVEMSKKKKDINDVTTVLNKDGSIPQSERGTVPNKANKDGINSDDTKDTENQGGLEGDGAVGMPCSNDFDCTSPPNIICSAMKICEINIHLNEKDHGGGGEGSSCEGLPPISECRPPFTCTEFGKCSAGANVGSSCKNGCRPGLVCGIENTCIAPSVLGGPCNTPDQCEAPMSCAPVGACVMTGGMGAYCNDNGEDTVKCASGLMCIKNGCVGESGSPCRVMTDCSPGTICSNGLKDIELFKKERRNSINELSSETAASSTTTSIKKDPFNVDNFGRDLGEDERLKKEEKTSPLRDIQEPKTILGIDKITGDTYYNTLIDLFETKTTRTPTPPPPSTTPTTPTVPPTPLQPKTIFDVGEQNNNKCDGSCLKKRKIQMCLDMKPFCNWLITPKNRLDLCQSHPVETVGRFNIPSTFCSLFTRISRPSRGGSSSGRANILVEKDNTCRFDPRSDVQSVSNSCKYVQSQYPHMCGTTCDVDREILHDQEVETILNTHGTEIDEQGTTANRKKVKEEKEMEAMKEKKKQDMYNPVCIYSTTGTWSNDAAAVEDQCCKCEGDDDNEKDVFLEMDVKETKNTSPILSRDITNAMISNQLEPKRKDVVPPPPTKDQDEEEGKESSRSGKNITHLLGEWGDPITLVDPTGVLKRKQDAVKTGNVERTPGHPVPMAKTSETTKTSASKLPMAPTFKNMPSSTYAHDKNMPTYNAAGVITITLDKIISTPPVTEYSCTIESGPDKEDAAKKTSTSKTNIITFDTLQSGLSSFKCFAKSVLGSSVGSITSGSVDKPVKLKCCPCKDKSSDMNDVNDGTNKNQKSSGTSNNNTSSAIASEKDNAKDAKEEQWGNTNRQRAVTGVNDEILQWSKKYEIHCTGVAGDDRVSLDCLRKKAAAEKALKNQYVSDIPLKIPPEIQDAAIVTTDIGGNETLSPEEWMKEAAKNVTLEKIHEEEISLIRSDPKKKLERIEYSEEHEAA